MSFIIMNSCDATRINRTPEIPIIRLQKTKKHILLDIQYNYLINRIVQTRITTPAQIWINLEKNLCSVI